MADPDAADDVHLEPSRVFALIWAYRDRGAAEVLALRATAGKAPPDADPPQDPELERLFRDLSERYRAELAPEHRLGPETVDRLWRHALGCSTCRLLVLEDGPDARPPKTQAELAQEVSDADAERARMVRKFWINLPLGVGAFGGAYACMYIYRSRQAKAEIEGAALKVDPRDQPRQIDPLIFGFMALVLVASWFLAEAYSVARELWIDFTAWKRAVPVVGKKWASKGKPEEPED